MDIVVVGLGLALLYVSLNANPKNKWGIVLGVLAVIVPIAMLVAGAGFTVSLSNNLLLALAAGALIGAIATDKSVWLMASITLAGAYAWLGLGAIWLVFVFAVLSAAFVAVENKKRTTLWLVLAVVAATVATLFAVNTAGSPHAQAPTPKVVASANR